MQTCSHNRHPGCKGVDVVLTSELHCGNAHPSEAPLDLINLKQCDSRLRDARVRHGRFVVAFKGGLERHRPRRRCINPEDQQQGSNYCRRCNGNDQDCTDRRARLLADGAWRTASGRAMKRYFDDQSPSGRPPRGRPCPVRRAPRPVSIRCYLGEAFTLRPDAQSPQALNRPTHPKLSVHGAV